MPNISWLLRKYIDDLFDPTTGHDHDGTDSKKVPWNLLDTTGYSAERGIRSNGSGGIETTPMYSAASIDNNFARIARAFTSDALNLSTTFQTLQALAAPTNIAGWYVIVRFSGVVSLDLNTSSVLSNQIYMALKGLRDATELYSSNNHVNLFIHEASENIDRTYLKVPFTWTFVDEGQSGTPTYSVQAAVPNTDYTASVSNRCLEVILTKK